MLDNKLQIVLKTRPQSLILVSSDGEEEINLSQIASLQNICPQNLTILKPEKSVITIEQIRELKRVAYLSTQNDSTKIFAITSAETMQVEAQTALLKLLEEPPQKTQLILCVGTETHGLLDTITSRVQQIINLKASTEIIDDKQVELAKAFFSESKLERLTSVRYKKINKEDVISLLEGLIVISSGARSNIIEKSEGAEHTKIKKWNQINKLAIDYKDRVLKNQSPKLIYLKLSIEV